MMKKNKGFTLIELLVVIAIIGILSSVILASLNNARDKGKDASVKSQLASMKAQGELFYSQNGELYTGVCTKGKEADGGFGISTDPGLLQAIVGATAIDSTLNTTYTVAGAYNLVTCHDSENSWAAEAPMNESASGTGNANMFCVDSTGYSGLKTTTIAGSYTACN